MSSHESGPHDVAWVSYIFCVWVCCPVIIVLGVADMLTP